MNTVYPSCGACEICGEVDPCNTCAGVRPVCNRCGKYAVATIMSMFNTQIICIACKESERNRPDYAQAEARDLREYAGRLRSQGMIVQAESIESAASTLLLKDG